VAAGMPKPLRPHAMIFNATVIAVFIPQHFEAWSRRRTCF
jgi:hypothetical protein